MCAFVFRSLELLWPLRDLRRWWRPREGAEGGDDQEEKAIGAWGLKVSIVSTAECLRLGRAKRGIDLHVEQQRQWRTG